VVKAKTKPLQCEGHFRESGVAKAVETYEIVARLAKLEEQLAVKGNNP
jgi:hypothetical protein